MRTTEPPETGVFLKSILLHRNQPLERTKTFFDYVIMLSFIFFSLMSFFRNSNEFCSRRLRRRSISGYSLSLISRTLFEKRFLYLTNVSNSFVNFIVVKLHTWHLSMQIAKSFDSVPKLIYRECVLFTYANIFSDLSSSRISSLSMWYQKRIWFTVRNR